MTTQPIDQRKAKAFAGRMLETMNGATLAVMASIGHQTGLFDTMARLAPSTSQQIADAAGLNERYVREWLGCMVTGRIVEYDPAAGTYRLPLEHAASLTRAAGPNNLAGLTQYIALMGIVEQGIIDCFRNGGGLPYSAFPRFQELQGQESAAVHDAALIDAILPLAPGVVDRLKAGAEAADVGCGQGHAINLLARAFPNSRFTGYDISEDGVAAGRAEAATWGLSNARFEALDAAQLAETGRFDLITAFDAIHDQVHPTKVLANIYRALKPGGTFLMVDIAGSSNLHENLDHPLAPTLYTFSTMHCMTVSLAHGGEGLGTMWGQQLARQKLAEAGFTHVDTAQIPGDILNIYYICRP
jgi:ubiquinone/menaquinone biosynthesis C-methylase UbiE